jgi:hypothetical protein
MNQRWIESVTFGWSYISSRISGTWDSLRDRWTRHRLYELTLCKRTYTICIIHITQFLFSLNMWASFRNKSKIVRSNKYCIRVKHVKGIKKWRVLRNEPEFFTFCAMYVHVMWRIIRACSRSRGKHVTSQKPYKSICYKCDLRIIGGCVIIQVCCRHHIMQRKKKPYWDIRIYIYI